jgi:hypothetical protein
MHPTNHPASGNVEAPEDYQADKVLREEEQVMDNQTRLKIKRAIADCDTYIAKESLRADDLRPLETQKLLEWYIAHREKLIVREASIGKE